MVDEDAAVVVESDGTFQALGSAAFYVVDCHDLSYTPQKSFMANFI